MGICAAISLSANVVYNLFNRDVHMLISMTPPDKTELLYDWVPVSLCFLPKKEKKKTTTGFSKVVSVVPTY